MENELKRTKKKLEILESDCAAQILSDFLDISTEGGKRWTDKGKIWLIQRLKLKYVTYIKENNKEEARQGNLFE